MITDRFVFRSGVALVAAGILTNPLFMGWVFSPDGRMHSVSLIIWLALLNAFLLCAGAVVLWRRKNLSRRSLVFSAVTTLLMLFVLEIGLHVIVRLFDPGHREINKRMALSIYRDSTWAPELFSEDAAVRSDVISYVGWRSHPYTGRLINVDSSGCRLTVQAPTPAGQVPGKLFVFGGSSAWGIYARDAQTIPSHLARFLNARGHPYTVTNEAEKGYTFMQGVIRLTILLQEGRRPDAVVFYDGFNDVINAYFSGHAGGLGLTGFLEGLLLLRQESPLKQVGMVVREFITRHSMLYRAIDRARKTFGGSSDADVPLPAYDDQARIRLALEIADTYASAHRLLEMLSREYNFSFACFLQPSVYTRARTSLEEDQLGGLSQDPEARKLFHEAYRQIDSRRLPHVFNLSTVLDKQTGTCYSDYCHVSEICNAVIAEGIADSLAASGVFPPSALSEESH